MATFIGTKAGERIAPTSVSASVTKVGGAFPSAAADIIRGKGGNDFVDSDRGTDDVKLGSGDDVFVWNDGDDNDVVDGGEDFDTLRFTASGAPEDIGIARAARHVHVTKSLGNYDLDLDGIERIVLMPLGQEDNIDVGNLKGTDLTKLVIDLAPVFNGSTGDGEEDEIMLHASEGDEEIEIVAAGAGVKVKGLKATTTLKNIDADDDDLFIEAAGGDDRIDATGAQPDLLDLVIFGGAGKDLLISGVGSDQLIGGGGKDILKGRDGSDFLNGAERNDKMRGDGGSDMFAFTVEIAKLGVDKILDFEPGVDSIGLGSFPLGEGFAEEMFHVGSAAAEADDRIIYNPGKGTLWYDSDGNGGAEAIKFAKLAKGLNLTHEDFSVLLMVA